MSKEDTAIPENSPVFLVIYRKFREQEMHAVNAALDQFEEALEDWPGFLGIHHIQSSPGDQAKLTTLVSFATLDDLIKWEQSDARSKIVAELSNYIEGSVVKNRLLDLDVLLVSTPTPKKWKTVLVLTFWVFVVGAILELIADFLSPNYPEEFSRYALLLTLNIILNSYFFLPKSMQFLHQLEKRFSTKA